MEYCIQWRIDFKPEDISKKYGLGPIDYLFNAFNGTHLVKPSEIITVSNPDDGLQEPVNIKFVLSDGSVFSSSHWTYNSFSKGTYTNHLTGGISIVNINFVGHTDISISIISTTDITRMFRCSYITPVTEYDPEFIPLSFTVSTMHRSSLSNPWIIDKTTTVDTSNCKLGDRIRINMSPDDMVKIKDSGNKKYFVDTISNTICEGDYHSEVYELFDYRFNTPINQIQDKSVAILTESDYCKDFLSRVMVKPNLAFIKSKEYIDITELAKKVDFFNITGGCKIVFQENDSLVWKTFDAEGNKTSLIKTDKDDGFIDEVSEKGNSNLNTFIDKFNDLKNIKFGFLLEGYQDEIDKIQMQFDAHGSFRKLDVNSSINRTNIGVTTTKDIKLMKTNVLINQ